MVASRRLADAKPLGDLSVLQSFSHERHDLTLTRGQAANIRRFRVAFRPFAREPADKVGRLGTIQPDLARMNLLDRLDESLSGGGLQDYPGSPELDGASVQIRVAL